MNTRLTDKVYLEKETIEREYKQAWKAFLAGDATTEFEEAYKKVKNLLKNAANGWIVMEDDWVYDNKIKACWLGLCNNSYTYKSYLNFDTGTNLNDALEQLRKHHKTKQEFDIATKEELLKSLTKIISAPFRVSFGTVIDRNSNSFYIAYKVKDTLQGYFTHNSYLSMQSQGRTIPLLRLTSENNFNISSREVFFRFIALDLTPKELKNDSDYKF